MKLPNICPNCEQVVELPSDKRFASISCSSCAVQLCVITRNQSQYLFDADDEDLFRHYRGKFRAEKQARYAANGWVAESKSNPKRRKSIFEQFAEARKFSLQNESIIELPQPAIELDFSDVECRFPIPTEQQTSIENEIRQIMIEGFQAAVGSELCYAIDVNHSHYTFIPSEVNYQDPDGWPIPITPFSEYLAFNSRCFRHGVFVDPRNRHISVYGDTLIAQFTDSFSDRLIRRGE